MHNTTSTSAKCIIKVMKHKLQNLRSSTNTPRGANALSHHVRFLHFTVCTVNKAHLQAWSYRDPGTDLSSCKFKFKYVWWKYRASICLNLRCHICAILFIAAPSDSSSLRLPDLTVSNLFKRTSRMDFSTLLSINMIWGCALLYRLPSPHPFLHLYLPHLWAYHSLQLLCSLFSFRCVFFKVSADTEPPPPLKL